MSESERQRVVRVPGSRRARLTPAPGTDAEPESPASHSDEQSADATASGPNDERMRRDVPPHY
ncbi:MAG: hypothetical protein P0Y48_06740 [Candidatus Microbacterium phytovorans]|uniref:Uncharacterized protein n=1 Tax=Candidatus Microbacterium phytovorans TaxID=3121374 RepID=A0AAJ5W607_9MICO|nr:hypothetical protein [Microbacterium sp.]WEK14880.1 MAG: hypothetical protein P0Y48_06740 [Microbacterium sp.]